MRSHFGPAMRDHFGPAKGPVGSDFGSSAGVFLGSFSVCFWGCFLGRFRCVFWGRFRSLISDLQTFCGSGLRELAVVPLFDEQGEINYSAQKPRPRIVWRAAGGTLGRTKTRQTMVLILFLTTQQTHKLSVTPPHPQYLARMAGPFRAQKKALNLVFAASEVP